MSGTRSASEWQELCQAVSVFQELLAQLRRGLRRRIRAVARRGTPAVKAQARRLGAELAAAELRDRRPGGVSVGGLMTATGEEAARPARGGHPAGLSARRRPSAASRRR
jgi:hypothetical protein